MNLRPGSAVATIEIEHPAEAVTRIVLSRPERLNAINFELVGDLHTALDEIALDDACKVVILTGRGRAFCSGLDLKDWGPLPAIGEHPHRTAGSTGQSFMSSLMAHLKATPQIVIAALAEEHDLARTARRLQRRIGGSAEHEIDRVSRR